MESLMDSERKEGNFFNLFSVVAQQSFDAPAAVPCVSSRERGASKA
jgi:hypothetical protein